MPTHRTNSCTAILALVVPPISNSLASSIPSDDAETVSILRQSNFYMICARPKAIFVGSPIYSEEGNLQLEIQVQGGVKTTGCLLISEMDFLERVPNNFSLQVKMTSDHLRIFFGEELIFATTPDDLLIRRGRKDPVFSGFDNFMELTTYDLLYVGIAKDQDSYSRLIEKGHKARMEILSKEPQRFPGARVSDETYLLLFYIDPLIIKTFGGGVDFDDDDLDGSFEYKRIIADAEKAIINIFQPKYNIQKYEKYPKGSDGLYRQGYTGYAYAIGEGITLNTPFGSFKGARENGDLLLSNDADFIAVAGNSVALHISGRDFNVLS